METLAGRRIRWTFDEGSMPNTTFEHLLGTDGSVTWTILDGDYKGASRREKSYAAMKVSERVWIVSYRAESGHTLTVALNLDDGRTVAFGSSDKSWEATRGRFELLD